jgi:hypothetical protein
MQGTKPRCRHMLVVLLACAIPGLALAAPPTRPAPKPTVKPAASQDSALGQREATQAQQAKAKAKVGQSRDGKKPQDASDDAARQPYQPLVDTVRKSTETFRDENVSESADRDRLPDPPGR